MRVFKVTVEIAMPAYDGTCEDVASSVKWHLRTSRLAVGNIRAEVLDVEAEEKESGREKLIRVVSSR